LPFDAVLYLPISIEMLDAVLDDDEPLEHALSNLQIPQIACLIVIQCLHTIAGKRAPTPERMLAETIEIGNRRAQQGGPHAFAAEALRVLDREKIRAGLDLLPDFKILLLSEDDVAFRSYLTADRNWDSAFCQRHRAQLLRTYQRVDLPTGGRRILTLEQSQIFLEIKNHVDDHLHVQGYAGTGKSFLIKSLLMLLQEKHADTLALAEHQRQLDALLAGTQGIERMNPRTFGALVLEMIPPDLTDPVSLRMRRTNYPPEPTPDEELVRHLGIHPSGAFTALEVVKAVRETVSVFCYSDDEEIGYIHLPRDHMMFDDMTRQVVLHHATELWKAILLPPSRDFQPRVRDHHRVKWAALKGLIVPARYTHILIDECHDVAKPMLQILDRSPQPAFSLGDEYQNLGGEAHRRSVPLRHRAVTNSVRAGNHIEDVVNSIIAIHPGNTKLEFHGNPLTKTEVSYYEKAHIPEQPATILVSDMWGLFEWAQRLAEGKNFELLSDPRDLKVFVTDLVELYQNDVTPRHRKLFRFKSWRALAEHYHSRRGFERIDATLRRGFGIKDWAKTSTKFAGQSTSGYALGLISDVRNREFESVMLAPDVLDWARDAGSKARAESVSAVYVAVTRARQRLIVPKRLRSWIEEIGDE